MTTPTVVATSRLVRTHSSLCAAITRPIKSDDDFQQAWDSLDYITNLPLNDLPPYESALTVLSKIDISKPPPGKGLYGLSSTAEDVIKFMNNPNLAWAPQHKFDYMAERSLTERVLTAEQMRPHMTGLLGWLADYNWPPFLGCRNQLARFPEATVDAVKEMFAEGWNDGELMEHILDFVDEEVPKGPAWDALVSSVSSLKTNASGKMEKDGDENGEWSDLLKRIAEWEEDYEKWKRETTG